MKCIIASIKGGLGNQMFQYAMARTVANYLGAELKLDLSHYRRKGTRSYELDRFRICAQRLSIWSARMINMLSRERIKRLPNILRPLMKLTRTRRVTENIGDLDKALCERSGALYLDGYWQSEKYFARGADVLRREFMLKDEPNASARAWIEEITRHTSISLHCRRGDYAECASTNRVHGVCSLEYYHHAIEYVNRLVRKAKYYIFSDDAQWTARNMHINQEHVFVTHNNGVCDVEDYRLMATCRHHIIANSTFSWWAAWMAPYSEKIVIAPRLWYANGQVSDDLIPEGWVRL